MRLLKFIEMKKVVIVCDCDTTSLYGVIIEAVSGNEIERFELPYDWGHEEIRGAYDKKYEILNIIVM